MYYKRIIDKYLSEWASRETRKPILLRGARQVGKSSAVLHEAMPSVLLRLSVFSCLQPNRNNCPRRCRRNRMSLCACFRVYYDLHIMFTNKSHCLFYGQRLSANNLRLVCTA